MHFQNFQVACAVNFLRIFNFCFDIRNQRPKIHQKMVGNQTFSTKAAKGVTLIGTWLENQKKKLLRLSFAYVNSSLLDDRLRQIVPMCTADSIWKQRSFVYFPRLCLLVGICLSNKSQGSNARRLFAKLTLDNTIRGNCCGRNLSWRQESSSICDRDTVSCLNWPASLRFST